MTTMERSCCGPAWPRWHNGALMRELDPDHEAVMLRAARQITDDAVRGEFFKHCADLLRPIRHINFRDVANAVAEARRRVLEL